MKRRVHHDDRRYVNVGSLIKQSRLANGMTQGDLADALFLSRAAISQYETGRIVPSADIVVRIILELDIDPVAFYDAMVEDFQV